LPIFKGKHLKLNLGNLKFCCSGRGGRGRGVKAKKNSCWEGVIPKVSILDLFNQTSDNIAWVTFIDYLHSFRIFHVLFLLSLLGNPQLVIITWWGAEVLYQ